MPRKKDDWTGIHKHLSAAGSKGWRAVVSGGSRDATPIKQWFPYDTSPAVMQSWRERTKAEMLIAPKVPGESFAKDAAKYLRHPEIVSLSTFRDRKRQIEKWVRAFGDRPRHTITSKMIRTIRDQWAQAPRSAKDDRALSASTLNHHTRALSNLWTLLDGRQGFNPVKDVDELTPPKPVARDIERTQLAKILAAFPDHTVAKKGETRQKGSKTLARIRVMSLTGIPPITLKALTPDAVDFKKRLLFKPARKKGSGQPPSVQPLTKEAVAAFRIFDKLGCWGNYSSSSLRQSFNRAVTNAGITKHLRPYDLRHTFLTELAKAVKDEVAVMEIAQHGDIKTTRRYTQGSTTHRVTAAMKVYEKHLREQR